MKSLQIVHITPRRAKYVHGFGEYVVINQPRVHRKATHEQNDVATGEEYVPDFVVRFFGGEFFLLAAHPAAEQRHDDAVPEVAEHHREQERERNDGVQSCNHE